MPASILASSLVLAMAWIVVARSGDRDGGARVASEHSAQVEELEKVVLPSRGVALPVRWNNLGAQLVAAGVVDPVALETLYAKRGTFTDEQEKLLLGQTTGKVVLTTENAGYLLNLLWALGLSQKSPILDSGEIQNKEYGGPGSFASTGGWILAQGDAMNHFSKHTFLSLTPEQHALVARVAGGIYRPCCDNSTHFPDCNHGMAMLGLLELMASQGVSEEEMWDTALRVNSFWFPDAYMTLALYARQKNIDWSDLDSQEILGKGLSSMSGYRRIAERLEASLAPRNAGGCGVDAGVPPPQESGGCSI